MTLADEWFVKGGMAAWSVAMTAITVLTSLGLADQFESKRAMTLREKTARCRHRESWKQTLMPYAA